MVLVTLSCNELLIFIFLFRFNINFPFKWYRYFFSKYFFFHADLLINYFWNVNSYCCSIVVVLSSILVAGSIFIIFDNCVLVLIDFWSITYVIYFLFFCSNVIKNYIFLNVLTYLYNWLLGKWTRYLLRIWFFCLPIGKRLKFSA